MTWSGVSEEGSGGAEEKQPPLRLHPLLSSPLLSPQPPTLMTGSNADWPPRRLGMGSKSSLCRPTPRLPINRPGADSQLIHLQTKDRGVGGEEAFGGKGKPAGAAEDEMDSRGGGERPHPHSQAPNYSTTAQIRPPRLTPKDVLLRQSLRSYKEIQ